MHALPLLLEVVSLRRSSEMCQHRGYKVEFKFPWNTVNSATKPKDVLPAIVVCVKVVQFWIALRMRCASGLPFWGLCAVEWLITQVWTFRDYDPPRSDFSYIEICGEE